MNKKKLLTPRKLTIFLGNDRRKRFLLFAQPTERKCFRARTLCVHFMQKLWMFSSYNVKTVNKVVGD